MTNATVTDVSTATFESAVIEASRERPVVVDFWAPWCGPCRMLGPLLERLAEDAGGAWTLAKVNVDQNPALSTRYGVQGIPAVKGFRDGRVAAEFVGAQPEVAVRRFLQTLLPSDADIAASEGQRLAGAGDVVAAEAAFRRALAAQADHPRALLRLGLLLASAGRNEEAEQMLAALLPSTPEGREAAPVLARLRLTGTAGSTSLTEAERAVEANPDDLAATLALAQALAAQEEYGRALPLLLSIVQRDRAFRNGAARTDMLTIFEALGADDPLTVEYRRKLASALLV